MTRRDRPLRGVVDGVHYLVDLDGRARQRPVEISGERALDLPAGFNHRGKLPACGRDGDRYGGVGSRQRDHRSMWLRRAGSAGSSARKHRPGQNTGRRDGQGGHDRCDACRVIATLFLRQRLDGGGSQTRVRPRKGSVAGERRPLDASRLVAARGEQLIRGVDLGESPTGLFAQPFVALEAIGMPYADEIEISLPDLVPVCRRMQIKNPQGPREGHRTLIVHTVEEDGGVAAPP